MWIFMDLHLGDFSFSLTLTHKFGVGDYELILGSQHRLSVFCLFHWAGITDVVCLRWSTERCIYFSRTWTRLKSRFEWICLRHWPSDPPECLWRPSHLMAKWRDYRPPRLVDLG